MTKQLPSVRDFIATAREAKHDSLGIGSDPEALIHLANVSRRAFLEQKDLTAFRDWSTAVEDVARLGSNDLEVREWLVFEALRLEKGHALLEELVEDQLRAVTSLVDTDDVSAAEREQIATTVEIAWRTPSTTAAGAEA